MNEKQEKIIDALSRYVKEDAQNYILSNHVEEEKVNNQKKKRFVPEQLKELRRNGEDYRNDKLLSKENTL